MEKVVIIGGGITGITVAKELKTPCRIIEKDERPGGLLKSYLVDDFIFDSDAHFLHFRYPEIRREVLQKCGHFLKSHRKYAGVYFQGKVIPFPVQKHLAHFPPPFSHRILTEIMEVRRKKRVVATVKEFLLHRYGKTFYRVFFLPYFRKLFGINLQEIPLEEIIRFFPQESLPEIIRGYLTLEVTCSGYNREFYYPERGGMESFYRMWMEEELPVETNQKVEKIYWKERRILTGEGTSINYEYLVYTGSLPDLPSLLDPPPPFTRERFFSNEVVCLNVGGEGKMEVEHQWLYFPEREFSFFRVGFYHRISPCLAPPGHFSLYVEISNPRRETFSRDKVLEDLERAGILKSKHRIKVVHPVRIKPAYPLFLGKRAEKERIIQWLRKQNIYTGGRFGLWHYSSIEDCIRGAKGIAWELNRKLG